VSSLLAVVACLFGAFIRTILAQMTGSVAVVAMKWNGMLFRKVFFTTVPDGGGSHLPSLSL
jgi:hypothetical protein